MREIVIALWLAVSLVGCGPADAVHDFQQEPIIAMSVTPSGNVVAFGASLKDREDYQRAALDLIEQEVRGRLPGVRFLVMQYPVWDPNLPGQWPSYRVSGKDAYVVLGWREDRAPSATPGTREGVFTLDGLVWETEHLVTGRADE